MDYKLTRCLKIGGGRVCSQQKSILVDARSITVGIERAVMRPIHDSEAGHGEDERQRRFLAADYRRLSCNIEADVCNRTVEEGGLCRRNTKRVDE